MTSLPMSYSTPSSCIMFAMSVVTTSATSSLGFSLFPPGYPSHFIHCVRSWHRSTTTFHIASQRPSP
ncbi:hypothetical protein ARMSODRAFT_742008 [Armillaria solidipes]|uniref:Uncharacterized protein n=1 Tax=Armillaria solidipes TaxID=1076256 RepID=A0A2H3BMI1_9AGAR|nr:hypothetical protein ARMSODRAFT_742008 [Armillaria solidipes]